MTKKQQENLLNSTVSNHVLHNTFVDDADKGILAATEKEVREAEI